MLFYVFCDARRLPLLAVDKLLWYVHYCFLNDDVILNLRENWTYRLPENIEKSFG